MIKYALKCSADHGFEGWFSNSADYDEQAEKGHLSCPACGSTEIRKDLMAPNISTSRRKVSADMQAQAANDAVHEAMRKARDYVEKNFEHVGKNFPEEARKIHYGETDQRPIYGEATPNEVKDLHDEGVAIAPLPDPAPDLDSPKNKLN